MKTIKLNNGKYQITIKKGGEVYITLSDTNNAPDFLRWVFNQ